MEKVSVLIQLQDKITQGIKKVSVAFSEVNREISAAKGQTEKFNNVCSRLKMPDLNAQLNIVTQFADQLSQLSEAGLGFGQSMADLSSITGMVGDDLKMLEQNSRKFGKEAGTGADVAARAYALLASQITIDKIGIEGLNILEERSITLAQASGMALDAAANALAGTINQFGLSAEEADRVVNVLAAGSKYGAAEIEDLSMSFKVVGAAASAMGLNVESTAGALEILSQANLKGSEAGTALRNIILKLNTELGFDLSKTSLSTALDSLKPRLTDAAYLSQVFGIQNIAAAQFLIQNAAAVEEMTQQVTGTNVALEQASIRTETTAHKLEVMKAKVEDLKISISDHLGGLSAWMAVLSENAMTLMMLSTLTGGIKNGIVMLNAAVVKLTGSTILHNIAVKASAAATAVWSATQRACTTLMALYRLAHIKLTAAIGSTTAATVALGAACTLGLSVAITGIVLLINKLCKKSSDATEDVDNLKDSTDAFTSATAAAKADIDMEVASLKRLIDKNGDATETVSNLNQKYGEALGYHKTAAEWYDTLVKKSEAYCQQLGYEAQAKVLASQKAEKQIQLDAINAEREKLAKTVVRVEWQDGTNGQNGKAVNVYGDTTQSYIDLSNQAKTLEGEVSKLQESFTSCIGKASDAAAALATPTATGVAAAVSMSAMSYDQLTKSIEETEKALKAKSPADKEAITNLSRHLAALNAEKKARDENLGFSTDKDKDEYDPNAPLDSIHNIDKAIKYQQSLKEQATAEALPAIGAEIARLEDLKTKLEEVSNGVQKTFDVIGDIKTFEELDQAQSYYESKRKTASVDERKQYDDKLSQIAKLRKTWDEMAVNIPSPIAQLNTIQELTDALSYYQDLQQKQSIADAQVTQREIDQLNAKKESKMALIALPSEVEKVQGLNQLSDKELVMELKVEGLDSLQSKIRNLQRLLADTKNPLGKDQRADVEMLIASYERYSAVVKRSDVNVRQAWGGIESIGNSIKGLSQTLRGNADMWTKVTSVIDTMLSIYDGFTSIIQLVQTLTAVTAAHSVAKGVEATAETTEMVTNTTAATAAGAASAVLTPMLQLETKAWMQLAAAKTFAAHASIPFVGTPTAVGFIGVQQAVMAAIKIPAFADGGIAYGPTLGIFGEYAGAKSNPEVVAPLDKLRTLIGGDDNGGIGRVEFEIKGRTLFGVLERENNIRRRS